MQQLYFRIQVLLCFVQYSIQFKVAYNVLHFQITKKILQSQFLFVADQVPLSGHLTLSPQVTTKDQTTKLVSGQLHLRTTFSRSEGVCLPELPLYSIEFQSKGEGQYTSSYQFLCALHPPPPHLYPKSIGLVTLPQ